MDKYGLLKNNIFSIPIMYSKGECEDIIDNRLSEYNDFLVTNNIGSVVTHEKINKFRTCIKKMYKEYYLGHQNKAYELFKEAFEYASGAKGPVKTVLPKEPLYRARVNSDNKDYENSEMFHIRFDLRSKVATQRYSFPGLPCLYLGASSYVCWLELNRPDFSQFQVAELFQRHNDKEYKIIDLCIHPLAFYNELLNREKNIKTEHEDLSLDDYLVWWPVMAVCSVAVKNEDDPFKPEYIFPQFVLQYFLEDNIDDNVGIKYMSIKAGRISMKQYETDYRTYTNYVIPVKSLTNNKNGLCRVLTEQFEIKNNVSGKEFQLISGMMQDNQIIWTEIDNNEVNENEKASLDDALIYTKAGLALEYGKSEFRKIEKVLSGNAIDELVKEPVTFTPIGNDFIKSLFE